MALDSIVITEFQKIVGAANCLTDSDAKTRYLQDHRKLFRGDAAAVIRPATTEEAASVVKLCAAANVGIVPQGGNTGLVGGATPNAQGDEVVISLERLNRIREIDVDNYTVTVEAGCVLQRLQDAATEAGLLFPLSLGAEGSCQIGGNLATNAGGNAVLRYGNIRSLTLGLEVVLPSGEIWGGLRGLRKDNTGYDLKNIFIGSEGSLGLITAAVLQLFPLPKHRTTCLLGFSSLEDLNSIYRHLRNGLPAEMIAFELIPGAGVDLAVSIIPELRKPVAESYRYYALVETADPSPDPAITSAVETCLAELFEAGLAQDAVIARSEAQRKDFWRIREAIVEMQPLLGVVIKHDVSVPVSKVGAFIHQAIGLLEKIAPGTEVIAFGHVGDGNVHLNILECRDDEKRAFLSRAHEISSRVYDLVDLFAGSFSAEHGIGQLRRQDLLARRSTVEIGMMRAVKHALDPADLFNRGKLFAV